MGRITNSRTRSRGTRVKLGGSILAIVLLENGRQLRARVSQLSANGGLLSLTAPLDEGIPVTVLFHLGSTTVRANAHMLFPMWATQGCLQPFRFLRINPEAHRGLVRELEDLARASRPKDKDEDSAE